MTVLEEKEEMEFIGGLRVEDCEKVWRMVTDKELVNQQKDHTWMAVHRCVPTREFQRLRKLGRNESCPREVCRGVENVKHVFLECQYARDVWRKLGRIIGLTGVRTVMFRLCGLDKSCKCFGKLCERKFVGCAESFV